MKTKIISAFLLLFLLFLGCGETYEYWDLSKFKMDKSALEDGEEIKLIYTSRGPDFNRNQDYYIHLVVVSQKSGDTVNVLTTGLNVIKETDGDKVFNFYGEDHYLTKLSRLDSDTLIQGKIKNVNELDHVNFKKIDKVARDPNFDDIADNRYPTIVGTIGETTKTTM